MKFIVNLILLSALAYAMQAHNTSNPMTKLEERLLDMVVDCKSCKDKQHLGIERPAFSVSLTAHTTTLTGTQEIVKFDRVILNRGAGYNPQTGIFTAPLSGLFQMSTTIMSRGGSSLHIRIARNEENLLNLYGPPLHGSTGTANPVIELKKGDNVTVIHNTSASENMVGEHYSFFFWILHFRMICYAYRMFT